MEGYLGETAVDVGAHPEFASFEAKDWAMLFIGRWGGIDGVHHKTWMIDQVSRILKGTPVVVTEAKWANGQSEFRFRLADPSADYVAWIDMMRGETYPDGRREYGWDVGIAP
jgi:hypothetical protein